MEASTLLSIDRSTTPLFDIVIITKTYKQIKAFDFIKYSPTFQVFE